MGDVAGAVEDCTRALALDPRHGPAFAARAAARIAAGDFEGALADTRQTLFPLHRVRGLARLGLGDADGALADFDREVDESRGRSGWVERGIARFVRGDVREALADFLTATPRERPDLLVWAARSRLGDRERADRELREAALPAPDRVAAAEALGPGGEALPSGSAAFAAGMRQLLAGDKAAAKRLFRRSLETAPRKDVPEVLAAALLARARD
jgi:tetratricopeptide (TPR) repeat protein